VSEDPDEATIRRRSENAEVAMKLGCLGADLLVWVLPTIALALLAVIAWFVR